MHKGVTQAEVGMVEGVMEVVVDTEEEDAVLDLGEDLEVLDACGSKGRKL